MLPVLVGSSDGASGHRREHADAVEYQFDVLESIGREPGRQYVFAHVLVPHPPFVFLEDGTYAPDEATFESQLAGTNRRIRAFVEPLVSLPEAERPIIIIQGDEGPYRERFRDDRDGFDWATASDAELLAKFGILNAMYLPGPEGDAPLRSGMTAVNTYPELFRRYFGSDVADRPDRVMASNQSHPFDLLDVTVRLEAAASN